MAFLWGMKRLLCLAALGGLLLAACQPEAPATTAAPEATPSTPAVAAPAAPPRYEGTYRDTSCALTIQITRRDTSYFFACNGVRGPVEVARDDADTGFTFVGLKGFSPVEDVGCVWQDSVLLIQNYGNAMNEYTRFRDCDAKYLELRRQ